MESKTAILLFARTASAEANQKQFTSVKSHRFNAFLAQAQLQRARKVASATHYPLIEVDSSQQVGRNFGERLSNAVDLVFSKGFKNVVIIGSDCLALSSGDIMQAVEELQQNNLVVGPNKRGGAYLIAFTKSSFKTHDFQNLAWETSCLLLQFKQQSASLLSVKSDFNGQGDFFGLTKAAQIFVQLVTSYFFKISVYTSNIVSLFFYQNFKSNYFRGPPFVIG